LTSFNSWVEAQGNEEIAKKDIGHIEGKENYKVYHSRKTVSNYFV